MSASPSPAAVQFKALLEKNTKPCDTVAVAKVYEGEKLAQILANVPGKSGSLRVLMHVAAHGKLDAAGIGKALEIFDPFVGEARVHPGKHGFIDFLLIKQASKAPAELRVETVEASAGLLAALVGGIATREQKQEGVGLLDQGKIRCAEKVFSAANPQGVWMPQLYAMDAMNGAFSCFDFKTFPGGFYDKVPLKTEGWGKKDFDQAGVRFIPGSFVRKGAYVGKGTTVMPGGIVNTGAYVAGDGVMIDGGARVATGAQVGKGVKLGAGSGIEGILEPKGRLPSIVEDKAVIGANCEVAGIVEEGALLASGTVMAAGKKIIDLRTGREVPPRYMQLGEQVLEIPYIPARRVAVNGVYMREAQGKSFGVACILLLEKDAGETSTAALPKNVDLYIRA